MKAIRSNIIGFFSASMLFGCVSVTAEQSKGKTEEVQLEPYTHEFYWESFSVTPDSPSSPDGRYRLKKVQDNGCVELIFSPNPSESQVIIAGPPPKKFEKGKPLPTVVVAESNPKAQTATLKALRMK